MKKLCYNCHYIGEIIKPRKLTYKFPLSGFLLGFSLGVLIESFDNKAWPNVKLIIEEAAIPIFIYLVILITGAYMLYKDLKSIKTKAPNKKSSLTFLIFGTILAIFGFMALFSVMLESNFTHLLSPLIWLFIGLLCITFYIRDSNQCPNCFKIETLISIDESRAQTIIRENNLTIPDDPVDTLEEPKPKMPWQA